MSVNTDTTNNEEAYDDFQAALECEVIVLLAEEDDFDDLLLEINDHDGKGRTRTSGIRWRRRVRVLEVAVNPVIIHKSTCDTWPGGSVVSGWF